MRKFVKGLCVIGIGMLVTGCSSNAKLSLLQDELELEYGEALPDLTEYVDVSKFEHESDVKDVTVEAKDGEEDLSVGKHKYIIQFGEEKKTFTVNVKDTIAPVIETSEISLFENETKSLENAITVKEASDYKIEIDDGNVDYSKAGVYEAKAKVVDASDNKSEANITVSVKEVKVAVSSTSTTLQESETFQLGVETNLEKPITFTSSNPAVASVDQSGNVSAIASGSAKITAEVNGKQSSCDVIVQSKPAPVYTPPVQQNTPQTDPISYTVYVTKTGDKYHRDGCRYLKKSKLTIDRSNAIAQGYSACSVCNP